MALIQERLNTETAVLEKRYKDVQLYNPSHGYDIGQKLAFSAFDYALGTVVESREGINPDYGTFTVLSVEFEDHPGKKREFAADFSIPHSLSETETSGTASLTTASDLTAEEIFQLNREAFVHTLEALLNRSPSLIRLAETWFPRDLVIELNIGHLNLAEAVLELAGGEPLGAKDILSQIGGLGDAPPELQVFSLDYALNQDDRFDEVGPAGQVMWYLTRLEPPEVLSVPAMLQYTPIDYDRSVLTPEMLALETEIGDELSPLDEVFVDQADITLTYPHRRLGTLPLNFKTRSVFPTANQASRIRVTLVDGQDDEEFPGWVVQQGGYVFGLDTFYQKHHLPIGAHVTVRRGQQPNTVIVDYTAHRPRTEWIRLITPHQERVRFENHKRAIGAEYDELMILGADDLAAVDALYQSKPYQSLTATLKAFIPELARLSPQATVHAKTLYSAVNVVRRWPPGPILATLIANPDFEDVGGHYWRLAK
jgi:hypothetical protein